MNNPYVVEQPTDTDFLDLFGEAQEIDYTRTKFGSSGWDTTAYPHDPYQFTTTFEDMGLTPAQMEYINSILPGTMYNYSGLNPEIMQALGQTFTGGYDIDLGELGLTSQQQQDMGLDLYDYSHQQGEFLGGTEYETVENVDGCLSRRSKNSSTRS